jgi:hypothetical protein
MKIYASRAVIAVVAFYLCLQIVGGHAGAQGPAPGWWLWAPTNLHIVKATNQRDASPDGVQSPDTAPPATESFTSYTWTSTGWSTFGLALEKGIATDGVQVGAFTTQTDVKVRHDDGSIRFAIVTVDITRAGRYGIKDSSAAMGTFLPRIPIAAATFTVSGRTHTAKMPSTMSPDCWLDGPLVKECRSIVTLDNNPAGTAQHLRVYFDTRVYSDGKSRVDVTVDNTKNIATANAVTYSVDLAVEGKSVFSKTATVTPGAGTLTAATAVRNATVTRHGLTSADVGKYVRLTSGTYATQFRRIRSIVDANTIGMDWYFPAALTDVSWELVTFVHPLHTRWRKTFAVNGFVEAEIVPDFQRLYESRATFPYLSSVTAAAYTNAGEDGGYYPPYVGYRWDILGIGNHEFYMPAPGGREELGFRPMVTAQYLAHKTQDLRQLVLRYGDLSGSRTVHFTDASDAMVHTGDLPTFAVAPVGCQGDGITAPAGGGPCPDTANGYWAENSAAHQPSVAMIPYLLTGDRYYADELKSWAEWCIISWGASGRTAQNALQILTSSIQVRALGWTLRDLTDAAVWLPDNDRHKPHFKALLQANLDNLQAYSVSFTGDPVLHSRPLNQATTLPGYFQGWMQIYLALGLHHAARNGFTATGGGTDLRDRIVDYWITRQTSAPVWPVEDCCPYFLWWKNGANGSPFMTLAQQYRYNSTVVPRIFPTAPNGTPRYGEHRIAALIGLETKHPKAQAAYDAIMTIPDLVTKHLDTMATALGPAFAFDFFHQ